MNDKIKKQIVALLAAVQQGDQKATQALQEIMNKAKQGDQKAIALASAIQSVAKEMQQGAQGTNPVAARFGAKLNYIRTLKGNAPEGEEVVYFKSGGQVQKKFVKKGAAGAKDQKNGKEAIKDFKKKACGGTKMKFADGGKPKVIINKNDTVHVNGQPRSLTNSDGTKVNPKSPYPVYSAKEYQKDRKSNKKDAKARVQKADEASSEKCGGKVKKHQFGGSLNGVPFIYKDL